MNCIMVDLETLGTSSQSCVVQVAAVPFKLGEVNTISSLLDGPKFNSYPTINSQTYARMDGDTIKWWITQTPEEARKRVFGNPMEETISAALLRLNGFLKQNNIEAGFCKGGNFDWPILNFHYKKSRIVPVLKYYQEFCSRTLVNVLRKGTFEITDPRLVKHDAFHDCVRQVSELQFVMKDYK